MPNQSSNSDQKRKVSEISEIFAPTSPQTDTTLGPSNLRFCIQSNIFSANGFLDQLDKITSEPVTPAKRPRGI